MSTALADVAHAKPINPCRSRASEPVAGSAFIRVVKRRNRLTACLLASGRSAQLGRASSVEDTYVTHLEVAGPHLAYVLHVDPPSSGGPFGADELILLTGKRKLRRVEIGLVGCDPPATATAGFYGIAIGAVALAATGQLAWSCSGTEFGRGHREIRKYDAAGPGLVDSDQDRDDDYIDIRSLGITSSSASFFGVRAYWTTKLGPHVVTLR